MAVTAMSTRSRTSSFIALTKPRIIELLLVSNPTGLSSLGEVSTIGNGVDLMADQLLARSSRVVVAVGRASAATDPVTNALIERLQPAAGVAELVEYRVGPSIAAHTGPNTVGGFSFPA